MSDEINLEKKMTDFWGPINLVIDTDYTSATPKGCSMNL